MKSILKRKFSLANLQNQEFLYKSYTHFIKIYSFLAALIEKLIFQKSCAEKTFTKKGIFKLDVYENINQKIKQFLNYKIINHKYTSIKIVESKQIEPFLNQIFNKELRDKITSITGYYYSIDFFIVYENKFIPLEKKNIRQAHFDKSFSKNMLKIFIPLNVLEDYGPLKVFDKLTSKSVRKKNLDKLKNILITGKGDFIYGLNPNVCFHEELNPQKNLTCKQVMFQLNPSFRWSYPRDLYERQFHGEVKFSSFKSIFQKMIPLE